ncbi:MAG TPA: GNAT family N-acetyltransferase [Burkholderiaceae bacterium]
MAASEAATRVVLDEDDVPGALALSDASGWNQTAEDWLQFLRHGRVLGVRSALGEIVATGAALPYDASQGWISMVLVTPAWRHRGLATELLNDCVSQLRARGITPVLDATPAGEQVYRRLGFAGGLGFERWEAGLGSGPSAAVPARAAPGPGAAGSARGLASAQQAARRAGIEDIDAFAALDAGASRIARRFLLESFLSRRDTRAWMSGDGEGFVIARAGRRATQVGPLVAADEAAATALLDTALAHVVGPVFIDVPTRWQALSHWLDQRGFRRQRSFLRMALGGTAALGGSDRLFAVAGPEFG